jgi:hypothetical protein
MWEMKRLLTVLVAAAMLVLAVGCSNNNAEVEQLRKELDEMKAATPIGVTTPTPAPITDYTSAALSVLPGAPGSILNYRAPDIR